MLKVSVLSVEPSEFDTPMLVVGALEGDQPLHGAIARLDERLGGRVSDVRRRGDFRGRDGETLLLYSAAGELSAERVLVVGLGKVHELTAERLRRAAAGAVKHAARLRLRRMASVLHRAAGDSEQIAGREAAQAVTEGFVLGGYSFTEMKSRSEEDEPRGEVEEITFLVAGADDVAEIAAGCRYGEIAARAENLARTLGNLPGNVATPTYLADLATRVATEYGLRCSVLGREELRAEGLKAILAVSQGSAQEPRLIVLEHRGAPDSLPPIGIIGKGLTFDAGGISIKPAQGMEEMKFDMSGGGAVIAVMQAVAELRLPLNVVGIVPASENLISGEAVKPGDIIGSHLGKTIEVVNTDAEGRLILADALSYIRRFEPSHVVDVATLTGSAVVALGHQASALMGTDDALIEELRAAGDRSGQRAWPLPMYDEYREQLRSDYADLKNSGGRPAGTITAGWFLREFVSRFAWAHLDIAGTSHGDGKLPYQARGATGVPTRLLLEWLRSRAIDA